MRLCLQIGHLAEVADMEIARVLSWHMQADMDCVVTLTTKKVRILAFVNNDILLIFYVMLLMSNILMMGFSTIKV